MLLIETLFGKQQSRVPLWMMRQAGRCLPEYRALRQEAGSFWNLCQTPHFAMEATLQPIRRFAMDGAILFSDILMVPLALGQSIEMIESVGPSLDPGFLDRPLPENFPQISQGWAPVLETIGLVLQSLPAETALIGFAGGPWTVACYMVEGIKTKDHGKIKSRAYGDPVFMDQLINLLTEVTYLYLRDQARAGVHALQLFESWGGILPEPYFKRWVLSPLKSILQRLKAEFPAIPLIVFPKGASAFYGHFEGLAEALNLDHEISFEKARALKMTLQGGLDPGLLLAGGPALTQEVKRILDVFCGRPYVFNLSHGVLPQTPIAHIEQVVRLVRGR